MSQNKLRALMRVCSLICLGFWGAALPTAQAVAAAEPFNPDEVVGGFGSRQQGAESGLALVVAKTAGISKFSGLSGKRVLRLLNDRLAETYLEIQCLRERGTPCRDQFSLIEEKRDVQSWYACISRTWSRSGCCHGNTRTC